MGKCFFTIIGKRTFSSNKTQITVMLQLNGVKSSENILLQLSGVKYLKLKTL